MRLGFRREQLEAKGLDGELKLLETVTAKPFAIKNGHREAGPQHGRATLGLRAAAAVNSSAVSFRSQEGLKPFSGYSSSKESYELPNIFSAELFF